MKKNLKCYLGIHDWFIHNQYNTPEDQNIDSCLELLLGLSALFIILSVVSSIFWAVGVFGSLFGAWEFDRWIELAIHGGLFIIVGIFFHHFTRSWYDATCLRCEKHILDYSKREYHEKEALRKKHERDMKKAQKVEDYNSWRAKRITDIVPKFDEARLEALEKYLNKF